MRIPARSFATLLLAVGVATCSDTPIATVKTGAGPALGTARLSFVPVFTEQAKYVVAHMMDFQGVAYDSVRIIIRGFPDTTVIVKDTTVFFNLQSDSLSLELDVPTQTVGQQFGAQLQYKGPAGVVFSTPFAVVASHPSGKPGTAPSPDQLHVSYVGPGHSVKTITVSPKPVGLLGGTTQSLSVSAIDSSGASITPPPIVWTSSNSSIATVTSTATSTALVQALSVRGTATITATAITGIADGTPVTVTLPAASIAVVSGAGQTGKVGSTLANPAVVQVSATDGIGVPGVTVVFAPPAGGAVGTTSAVTDANGRAQTTLKLGSAVGPQSFAATAGAFAAAIAETATAGDPSAIAIVSGNNQTATVNKPLPAALSVRVTDSFGNAVGSGVTVSWARTSGGGALGSATSATNADGVATNTYTTGGTTGPETVSASITGASVSFSFTTTAGVAASITIVSGSGQTGRVAQALSSPFVVKVTDATNNPVPNTAVSWSATNGTISTTGVSGADGQSSATLTAGTGVGPASAVARIANGQSVTFVATIQAGTPTQLAFTTQPSNGAVGAAMPAVAVGLRDIGVNLTSATNAVTIALGNNPSGATLAGTLTRNAVNGTATFDDLKLDKIGSGYTLVATSTGLPPVTSSAFNVGIGAAAQLILVPATPTSFTKAAGGAVPNPPKLKTADVGGNAVGSVAVLFTVKQGTTTLGTQTLTSDASGLIDAANVSTPDIAGTYTITGSLVSQPSATLSVTLTVTAGAADHLVVSGNAALVGTAASGTTTFTQSPTVTVFDAFNNLVPTAQVFWTTVSPCASGFGFATSPATSTTNSSGIATAPALTVPNGIAGSCPITASLDNGNAIRAARAASVRLIGGTSASLIRQFKFYAIMKPSGTTAWTANSSQDFNTPANWDGVAVPTSTSAVFIPNAAPLSPTLSADGAAASVTMETGSNGNIALNTKTLTVSGAVDANAGGINNGTLKIEATTANTQIRGTLPTTAIGATSCGSSSFMLFGATTTGPLTVNCQLTIGANSLTTVSAGNLTVTGTSGKLIMTTAGGVVDVAGLATFQAGSTTGTLTNGTLTLRGGFKALLLHDLTDVFAPSGSHVTQFLGTTEQHVDMCIPCSNGSWFNNTSFGASSDVYFDQSTNFTGTFDVGANATLETGLSATTLTVSGDVTTASGSNLTGVMEMILTGGTRFPHFATATQSSPAKVTMNAALPMDASTTVGGDLAVNNLLTVGANTLTVGGSFSTATSTGKLNMTNAASSVIVNGAATFAGASTNGSLTNGTLEVRGDLTQSNAFSSNSFTASGSHLTKLAGTGAQSVFFISTASSSQFNDLSVENTSSSGVTFTSIGNAARDLNIGVTGGATTTLTLNQTFNVGGNLNAKAGAKPLQSGAGKRIIVTGAVIGDALADLGGVDSVRVVGTTFPIYNNTANGKAPRLTHLTPSGAMSVAANGTIAGSLAVDDNTLSLNGKALVVKENFSIETGGTFNMSNTAGTLTVGGDFKQNGGNFNPSSGSLVTLNGTGTQTISFLNASDNFFGSLDITNTSSGGVQLSTNAATNGDLRVRASAKLSVPASQTLTVGPSFTLFLHNNSTIDVAGTVSFGTCQKGTGVTITGAGSSGLSTGCASSGSIP